MQIAPAGTPSHTESLKRPPPTLHIAPSVRMTRVERTFVIYTMKLLSLLVMTACTWQNCSKGCTEITPGFGGPCLTGVCLPTGCRCLFCRGPNDEVLNTSGTNKWTQDEQSPLKITKLSLRSTNQSWTNYSRSYHQKVNTD